MTTDVSGPLTTRLSGPNHAVLQAFSTHTREIDSVSNAEVVDQDANDPYNEANSRQQQLHSSRRSCRCAAMMPCPVLHGALAN